MLLKVSYTSHDSCVRFRKFYKCFINNHLNGRYCYSPEAKGRMGRLRQLLVLVYGTWERFAAKSTDYLITFIFGLQPSTWIHGVKHNFCILRGVQGSRSVVQEIVPMQPQFILAFYFLYHEIKSHNYVVINCKTTSILERQ